MLDHIRIAILYFCITCTMLQAILFAYFDLTIGYNSVSSILKSVSQQPSTACWSVEV